MAPNFGRSISFPLTPATSFSKSSHHVLPPAPRQPPRPHRRHPRLDRGHRRSRLFPCFRSHRPTRAPCRSRRRPPPSRVQSRASVHHQQRRRLPPRRLPPPRRRAPGLPGVPHAAQACGGRVPCCPPQGRSTRLASAARSQRRAEKVLTRLAASVSAVSSKCARLNLVGEDAEMAGAMMEAVAASAAASAALFSAAASMSSPASSCNKMAMFIPTFATRKAAAPETAEAAMERLYALECFDECDDPCDMVFRSVVQTRVSLLNIMTPTI
uniref:Uncharacterized protein n=2 Tax=Aegilops tauschii subsp. strangulata TaxID=200361 RepID=A0A453TAQ1_AEGTS